MIDSKDISVVIQGAIDPIETKKCISSIKQYLPGAEIILSTWENSNLEGLEYDHLVLSKDPGAFFCNRAKSAPLRFRESGQGRRAVPPSRHPIRRT